MKNREMCKRDGLWHRRVRKIHLLRRKPEWKVQLNLKKSPKVMGFLVMQHHQAHFLEVSQSQMLLLLEELRRSQSSGYQIRAYFRSKKHQRLVGFLAILQQLHRVADFLVDLNLLEVKLPQVADFLVALNPHQIQLPQMADFLAALNPQQIQHPQTVAGFLEAPNLQALSLVLLNLLLKAPSSPLHQPEVVFSATHHPPAEVFSEEAPNPQAPFLAVLQPLADSANQLKALFSQTQIAFLEMPSPTYSKKMRRLKIARQTICLMRMSHLR